MEGSGFIETRATEGWEVQGPVHASELSKILQIVERMRDRAANDHLYPTDIVLVPWDDGKIRVQFERGADALESD